MTVEIHLATPDEIDPIAALEESAFPSERWSRILIYEAVVGRVPTTRVLSAADDGDFAGYAVVSVVDDVAELQRIAVPADRRRTGIASDLLAEVDALAGAGGAARLLLEVRVDNAGAQAFYERHGFAELARRRGYYRDGTDAVVLERAIGQWAHE